MTVSATSSGCIMPGELGHVGRPPTAHREVGRHPARTDVGAADAVLAQLVVEGAGESDLRELRGAVHGLERKAAPPRFACQRHDVRGGLFMR